MKTYVKQIEMCRVQMMMKEQKLMSACSLSMMLQKLNLRRNGTWELEYSKEVVPKTEEFKKPVKF